MAAFATADFVVPEDLHEIARLRLAEIRKITAESKLIKQTRGAGTVCVPPSPHPFAIMLVPNDQLIQGGEIELQLATISQLLDGPDENKIGRARAEADIRLRRDHKKLPGLKMRGGLQFDFCNV